MRCASRSSALALALALGFHPHTAELAEFCTSIPGLIRHVMFSCKHAFVSTEELAKRTSKVYLFTNNSTAHNRDIVSRRLTDESPWE